VELWILAAVITGAAALCKPTFSGPVLSLRRVKDWLVGYCIVFFVVYAALRLVSPEVLAGQPGPNDGRVWQLATVAWASAVAGALLGAWVRKWRRQGRGRSTPG
jgi:hypothetical protein